MYCWKFLRLHYGESLSFCQRVRTYWSGIRGFHHDNCVAEQIVVKSCEAKEECGLGNI